MREVLGDDPSPAQVRIAESVRDHVTTAVPSCHASGKSHGAARVGLWFLYSHPSSVVITTAPTKRQVEGILWKEISTAHARARYPLGGRCLTTQLKIDTDWYAWGFTAPDWDPNRFQGFHADHILVIRDEASGIGSAIAEQIDSILSGGHARDLQIGNPTDPFSSFKAACDDSGVHVIPISAFDTENFTAFGITEADIESGAWEEKLAGRPLPRPYLCTPQWVATMLRRYGKTSPFYIARVLGRFPDEVEGAYYGAQMRVAKADGRIREVPIDPALRTYTAWDLGVDDSMTIWWAQVSHAEVRLVDYYENRGYALPHYIGVVKERQQRHGFAYEAHYAPADISVREMTSANADGYARTRLETAAELGVHFTIAPRRSIQDGIDQVRNILARCYFDTARCERGIKALQSYRAEEDEKTGELRPTPLHDWASHGADAICTLALGLQKPWGEANGRKVDTRWVV